MEVRPLGTRTGAAEASQTTVALVGLIGDRSFGQHAIGQIDRLVRLNWWTVYRMFDAAPPELYLGGHLRADDVIADSFNAYQSGLWREDQVFALARERVRGGGSVMTHQHAREMQLRHRSRIYTRHKLADRLSLVGGERDGGALAVNLYRHVESKPFSEADRDRLDGAAPVILACVARHIALHDRAVAVQAGKQAPAPVACLAGLPRREREVCQRLLRGWTHEGVAADLRIATTTVKTYRDRAFERLGIHHRNELFALAMRDASAPLAAVPDAED